MFTKLTKDGTMLFGSRILRMFAYGFLSVVLVLYLSKLGLNEFLIGFLLSATLMGDAAISLWMTTSADRVGWRRILVAGAGLMLFASLLFAATDKVALLLIAARSNSLVPWSSYLTKSSFMETSRPILTGIHCERIRASRSC